MTLLDDSTPDTPDMPTIEELVRWLRSQRLSLWGNYFLMEKERPQACAEWILHQVTRFLEWRQLGSPDEPVRKHGYEKEDET